MREFFSSKKFKVILAIIALLFGMMLYSASGDGNGPFSKSRRLFI